MSVSLLRLAATAALALALGGCAYDYMQHTDRVSFHGGDAVHANLEQETVNPSKRSMKSVAGLGRNGSLLPATAAASAPSSN